MKWKIPALHAQAQERSGNRNSKPRLRRTIAATAFVRALFHRPVIPNTVIQIRSGLPTAAVGLWLACFVLRALAPAALAQTNGAPDEEIPPLLPPRGEMPPTFGEQYGVWLVLAGIVAFLLVCGAVWFLLRPRPATVIPPAAQARTELEQLRQKPEDGAVLTRVSQVLRRYVAAAFGLTPEERTTAEFCNALGSVEEVGPELSSDLTRFLKECDIRKFAPASTLSTIEPVGAVPHAFNLIDEAEARLAQLEQAAAASPPVYGPDDARPAVRNLQLKEGASSESQGGKNEQ